jgi:CYTH domain-containing protein
MAQEIERKYVLSTLPSVDLGIGVRYVQSYVTLPKDNVTMRLRLEGENRVLTFKSKGLISREEANLDLNDHPEIFDLLLENAEEGRIVKTRYSLSDEEGQIEIDVYEGKPPTLKGKIVAEREFASEEAMKSWQPPWWLVECRLLEVSEDPRYKNSSLMRSGWPE